LADQICIIVQFFNYIIRVRVITGGKVSNHAMKTNLIARPLNEKHVNIVGNLNIDLIIRNVPGLPKWGQEILGDNYVLVSSGQSAYTAFALSKFGVPTSLVGNVGSDIYGEKITQDLAASGLDISSVEVVQNGNTGITVAIVRKDGERAFVSDPSSLSKFDRELVERHLSKILSASIVCLVGIFFLPSFSLDDASYLFQSVRNAGKLSLLDTGWDPDNWGKQTVKDLRGSLQFVDFFIPNMDEARAITGIDDPHTAGLALLSDGCGTVVIKLGGEGSLLVSNSGEIHIPAHKVNVYDAVGAGDVFNAGFIFGTLQDWPLEARMVFGTATSASYISKPTDRFPGIHEVISLANQHKEFHFEKKE